MEEIIVRKAVRKDMGNVMQLIIDLATFEGYPDGPQITKRDLERDGFDLPSPLFHCIVAERVKDKTLVGQAMFNFAYSSWGGAALYLEDIYVSPECRGKKIGHKLFAELCKVAKQYKCCRIDWHVLNDNYQALKFYTDRGAVDICKKENRTCMRIYDEKINESANTIDTKE